MLCLPICLRSYLESHRRSSLLVFFITLFTYLSFLFHFHALPIHVILFATLTRLLLPPTIACLLRIYCLTYLIPDYAQTHIHYEIPRYSFFFIKPFARLPSFLNLFHTVPCFVIFFAIYLIVTLPIGELPETQCRTRCLGLCYACLYMD